MTPTYPEKILLDALESISATQHNHTDRIILNMCEEADKAIAEFKQEKERIENIPPY